MADDTPASSAQPPRPVRALSQPLVWLVLGIPAATVVAGFVTLWIAHNGSDVPVGSAYVKQGLSVAPDNRREERARSLGLGGKLSTETVDGQLRIRLQMHPPASGTAPASGNAADARRPRRLRLLHPSNPDNDLTIHLRAAQDHWQASQPVTWAPGSRWHIAIEGDDWRLPVAGLQHVEALDGLYFGAPADTP